MHLHSVSIQLLLSDYIAIYSGSIDIRLIHVEAQRYEDAQNEGYTPIFSAHAAQNICKRTRLEASQILEFMDGLFSYTHAFSHYQIPVFVLRQQDFLSLPMIVENQEFEEYQQELNQRNRISALGSVSITEIELDGLENYNDEAYLDQGTITFNSYDDATADGQNADLPPDYQNSTRLQAQISGYVEINDDDDDDDDDDDEEEEEEEDKEEDKEEDGSSFQSVNILEEEESTENVQNINESERRPIFRTQKRVYQPGSPVGNVYYYNKPLSPSYSVNGYDDDDDDVLLLISSSTNISRKHSFTDININTNSNSNDQFNTSHSLSEEDKEEEKEEIGFEDEVPIEGTTMTGDLLKGECAGKESTPPDYTEQMIKLKNSKSLAQTEYPFHKKYQFKKGESEDPITGENVLEIASKNIDSDDIKHTIIQTVREIPENKPREGSDLQESDLHQQSPQSASYARSLSPTPSIWKRFFRKR
ncbi:uncharacterized protein SAPINGB_P002119 [Magnusiomyces paraingens]|uniref:Uncharacterized protein n=1 Tax=Magnusiomyces paraingens TaxID=2606893 RepID=A0A5E8BCU7_9ASCO|nr:uncharacterized protein SAPINGB_P002119 [Saprochaete ingens]VVT49131.1 unnamed protein product [Saprochaete ingens]